MKLVFLLILFSTSNAFSQDAVLRDGNCPSGYHRDGNYCVATTSTPAKTYQRQADEANAAMLEKGRQRRESIRVQEDQEMSSRCAASGYGYFQGRCVPW